MDTQPPPEQPAEMTTPEVLDRLRISRTTLERWVRDENIKLDPIKVGGRRRFDRAQVEALATGATS